jgi:hypothetical protein
MHLIHNDELEEFLDRNGFIWHGGKVQDLAELYNTAMPVSEVKERIQKERDLRATGLRSIPLAEQYRRLFEVIVASEDTFEILQNPIYDEREGESEEETYQRRSDRYDNRFKLIIGRDALPADLYGYTPRPDAKSVAFAEKYGGTDNDILMFQSGAMEYKVLFMSLAETLETLKKGKVENMKKHGWDL